jgi:hypothetical protein
MRASRHKDPFEDMRFAHAVPSYANTDHACRPTGGPSAPRIKRRERSLCALLSEAAEGEAAAQINPAEGQTAPVIDDPKPEPGADIPTPVLKPATPGPEARSGR